MLSRSNSISLVVAAMLLDVSRFNKQVTGLPMPDQPKTLGVRRARWAETAMLEEVQEFMDATAEGNVPDAADALVDLVYFALGRLAEMGVPAKAVFDDVQRANMEKQQGTLSKRPGSLGHDAVKPANWKAPNHEWLVGLDLEMVESLQRRAELWDQLSPIFQQIQDLRIAKGGDYNNVPGGRDAYFPFGHASYVHMLQTKVLRLQSLARHIDEGRAPKFEGMLDSVRDLANYAAFYGEALIDGRLSMASSTAAPLSLAGPSGSDAS